MTTATTAYHTRMQRVLDHIDHHLDDALDVMTLSRVAAFSPFHFHRQFSALFGISVTRYIQLTRLKRAGFQLAFRDGQSVTDVALDAGYEAPEAFARAFRKRIGQPPSAFRHTPAWQDWQAAIAPLATARSKTMTKFDPTAVALIDFPATPILFLQHRGDPASVGGTIQRFIAWRRAKGLSPQRNATFNIFHDDPLTTPSEAYRVDIAVATDRPPTADEPVARGLIPAGRCFQIVA
jgi:AraC family transcriptional regulator